jgi:hypothetical protein
MVPSLFDLFAFEILPGIWELEFGTSVVAELGFGTSGTVK